MSPTPTVLPVDAPPPIPDVSPYPEGLSSFYYPGYTIETMSATFDPTKPSKAWSRPVQPGENPASVIVFGYFTPAGQYVADELFMSRADAAATNIAPASAVSTAAQQAALAGSVYMTQSVPRPARPPLPTETITPMAFVGFIVTNSAVAGAPVPETAQQQTDSTTLQRILAAEQEELAKDGLPPV